MGLSQIYWILFEVLGMGSIIEMLPPTDVGLSGTIHAIPRGGWCKIFKILSRLLRMVCPFYRSLSSVASLRMIHGYLGQTPRLTLIRVLLRKLSKKFFSDMPKGFISENTTLVLIWICR